MKIKKLNILHINQFAVLGGGAEEVLLGLISHLDKSLFESIIALPRKGALIKRLNEIKVKVVPIEIIELKRTYNPMLLSHFLVRFFLTTFSLIKIIKRYEIDLIHANSFHAGLFAGIASKVTGIPLICHIHRIFPQNRFYKTFFKILEYFCFKIIAISKSVKSELVVYGIDSNKIEIIYNGVDLDKFIPRNSRQEVLEEFQLNTKIFLLGTVGQLSERKGHIELLKATQKVLKLYPKLVLFIVGDTLGENKKYKERIIDLAKELGILENMILTGYRPDVPRIMGALDVFILSSRQEPFGLVVIEAMAMNKAVVATAVGGVPEIVEDGVSGILVPPGDPDKLAKAIIELLENEKKREQMGQIGRRIVEEKFDLFDNIRKIEKIYLDAKYIQQYKK